MKKSPWRHFKNKWLIAAAIVIVAIVVLFWMRSRNKAPAFEFATASIGNVIERVSVTGTISPVDKADLAFEKGGVIARVNVKVGDKVKKGDVIASLKSADDAASVRAAEAQLAEVSRSLRPEEYASDRASVDSAAISLANAEKSAKDALRDSYVKAQGAIVNYADVFFTNPQSANPRISIQNQDLNLQRSISDERLSLSDMLKEWKGKISSSDMSTGDLLFVSEGYLGKIKAFMDDLSPMINDLNPSNSGLSQTIINSYIAAMNSAQSNLNQAISSISNADTAFKAATAALNQAHDQFDLQKAGSSDETIAAQAARVEQARAILAKDSMVSPIDGVVTKADPSVGEFIAAGQSGFAVQNSDFKIEAFVPEADIAKIAIGNIASSTLDAYGSYVDFPAQVAMVDPAETVLEGVPTYKVTLRFLNADPRIRSGMTANLEILTHEIDGVLNIPYRAIVDNNGSKSVRLVSSDGKSYSSAPVEVGLKGSNGTIELISGLKVGDNVVTYVK